MAPYLRIWRDWLDLCVKNKKVISLSQQSGLFATQNDTALDPACRRCPCFDGQTNGKYGRHVGAGTLLSVISFGGVVHWTFISAIGYELVHGNRLLKTSKFGTQ